MWLQQTSTVLQGREIYKRSILFYHQSLLKLLIFKGKCMICIRFFMYCIFYNNSAILPFADSFILSDTFFMTIWTIPTLLKTRKSK